MTATILRALEQEEARLEEQIKQMPAWQRLDAVRIALERLRAIMHFANTLALFPI